MPGKAIAATGVEPQAPPIAYGPESAAKEIDVSKAWLYEQIRLGNLPSRKIGGRRLILREDLVRFVREGAPHESGT